MSSPHEYLVFTSEFWNFFLLISCSFYLIRRCKKIQTIPLFFAFHYEFYISKCVKILVLT